MVTVSHVRAPDGAQIQLSRKQLSKSMSLLYNEIFSNLPHELLENIVILVDKPQDLLSLALCCKTFSKIIIPIHLCFRNTICPPTSARLWEYMAQHPVVTSNIRSLHLVEGVPITKPANTPTHILEKISGSHLHFSRGTYCDTLGIHLLCLAMQYMTFLTRFSFVANTPPMCRKFQYLYEVLKDLPVEFEEFNLIIKPKPDQVDLVLFPTLIKKQLKALRSCTLVFPSGVQHAPVQFLDFLIYETDLPLQSFYLEWRTATAIAPVSDLLRSAHWKLLRQISLIGFRTFYANGSNITGVKVTNDFIMRHEQLEAFKLADIMLPKPQLFSPKHHPSLKSLSIGPLHTITVSKLLPQIEHLDYLLDLRNDLPSLKSCVLYAKIPGGMSKIVERVPQGLEKLQCRIDEDQVFSEKTKIKYIESQIFSLKKLSRLTHLSAWTSVSWGTQQERIIEKLASVLPQLRFLELPASMGQDNPYWVSLKRDTNNKYLGCSPVENILDASPEAWGGIFTGSYVLETQNDTQ